MLTGGFIARCCCSLPLPIHICDGNSNMGLLLTSIPLSLDCYALDGGQGVVCSSHSSLSLFFILSSLCHLSTVRLAFPRPCHYLFSFPCEVFSLLSSLDTYCAFLVVWYTRTNEHIHACIYIRAQKKDVTAIDFRGHGSLGSWVRGCRCSCCIHDNDCFKGPRWLCDFDFDFDFFFSL